MYSTGMRFCTGFFNYQFAASFLNFWPDHGTAVTSVAVSVTACDLLQVFKDCSPCVVCNNGTMEPVTMEQR